MKILFTLNEGIMVSPAQQFLKKHYAGLQRNTQNVKATNAYEMMLAKLNSDRIRLKKFQSKEAKIELKKILIPEYLDWIDGVLKADNAQQDDVFMRLMVWMIDTKQFELAYPLAEHAIKHNWITPDEYKRQTAALIAEELANTTLTQLSNKQEVNVDILFKFAELVNDKDMFDEVRAKLSKAIGLVLKDNQPEQALSYLKRALELDENSGVKGLIKTLEKTLEIDKS
ncbi:phage terminase small subunit [Utexia brackfieldae]|uniref:phage terminase small subunit n=1 Tax=Utexia brackfieldae TaxID=3074108 RepID=UPI00370D5DD2